MSLRPHPTQDGHWQIDVGYNEQRRRIAFEGTLEQARIYERELRKARKGVSASRINGRICELAPDYLDHYRLNQSSPHDRQERSMAEIIKILGNQSVNSLSPAPSTK